MKIIYLDIDINGITRLLIFGLLIIFDPRGVKRL